LNPRASIAHFLIGEIYLQLRHYAESEQTQLSENDLAADPGAAHVRHAETLLYWKRPGCAARCVGALTPGSDAYSGTSAGSIASLVVARLCRSDPHRRVERGRYLDRSRQSRAAEKLCLAQAYAAAGDSEAKPLFEKCARSCKPRCNPRRRSGSAFALGFADAGRHEGRSDCRRKKRSADAVGPNADPPSGWSLGKLAQIYVRLGANEEAIDILQQLFAMPAGHVVTPPLLKLDPVWDSLREDSRFKNLLASDPPPVPTAPKH
jgi:tetratricopeptide (TPR) repeat protein